MRPLRLIILALPALAAWPSSAPAQDESSVTEKAMRAHREGDHPRAAALWEIALHDDPDDVVVRTNLARSLIEIRDLDRAEEELARIFEREPERPSAHNLMGRVKRLRGNHLGAIEEFQRAIAGNRQQAWYHNNLGLTLIDLGRHEEAIPPLRVAVSIDSGQPVMWNNLGYARMQRGDLEGAREAFERALALSPAFEKARRNLDAVAAMAAKQTQPPPTDRSTLTPAPEAPTPEGQRR